MSIKYDTSGFLSTLIVFLLYAGLPHKKLQSFHHKTKHLNAIILRHTVLLGDILETADIYMHLCK